MAEALNGKRTETRWLLDLSKAVAAQDLDEFARLAVEVAVAMPDLREEVCELAEGFANEETPAEKCREWAGSFLKTRRHNPALSRSRRRRHCATSLRER